MDKEIIGKIVKTERELERSVEEAQKSADEWLGGLKRNSEEKLKAEEEALNKEYSKKLSQMIEIAEKKAFGIITEAQEYAEELKGLDDDFLKKITLKYLKRIVSEDDYQDVKD